MAAVVQIPAWSQTVMRRSEPPLHCASLANPLLMPHATRNRTLPSDRAPGLAALRCACRWWAVT